MKRLLFFMLLATQVAAAQFPVTEVNRTFQRIDDEQAAAIDDVMLSEMTDLNVPGCGLGIVLGGEIAYISGYGFRNSNFDCDAVADGYTQFATASICKPMTGLMVLSVARDYPEFSIDDLIQDWLTPAELPAAENSGKTIRDLLNHAADMEDWGHLDVNAIYDFDAAFQGPWTGVLPPDFDPLYNGVDALEIVRNCQFDAGDKVDGSGNPITYANSHYMVLGAIVQKVTGRRYTELMREFVSDFVGMHQTEPDYPWRSSPNVSQKFNDSGGTSLMINGTDYAQWPWISMLPSSGWLTSAADWSVLLKAIADGQFNSMPITSVFGFSGGGSGGGVSLSHTGAMPGVMTRAFLEGSSGNGYILLGNCRLEGDDYDQFMDIVNVLRDELNGVGVDSGMEAYDGSERADRLGVYSDEQPYENSTATDFHVLSFDGHDRLVLENFEGYAWAEPVSIFAPSPSFGDVRVCADDKIILKPGFEVRSNPNGNARFVAYIDNVGDFVSGDGSQCFGDTRSAEDEAVEVGATGLTLWPNPSDGRFRIDGLREQDRLIVLDMVGRVVLEQAVLNEGGMELDVSAQPPGIYFARAVSKEGTADTRRFVIR